MPPKGWTKTYLGFRNGHSEWGSNHTGFLRAVMHRVKEMGYDAHWEIDLKPEFPLRVDLMSFPRGTEFTCFGGRRFRFPVPPEAVFEVKVKPPLNGELNRILDYGEATGAKRLILVMPSELRHEVEERRCAELGIEFWTPSLPFWRYSTYDFVTREQKFLAQLEEAA